MPNGICGADVYGEGGELENGGEGGGKTAAGGAGRNLAMSASRCRHA
jgi:hypothetical protein